MSAYVAENRARFGVEPICRTLGVSASAYYERRSGRRSARAVEDERLLAEIRKTHAENGSTESRNPPEVTASEYTQVIQQVLEE